MDERGLERVHEGRFIYDVIPLPLFALTDNASHPQTLPGLDFALHTIHHCDVVVEGRRANSESGDGVSNTVPDFLAFCASEEAEDDPVEDAKPAVDDNQGHDVDLKGLLNEYVSMGFVVDPDCMKISRTTDVNFPQQLPTVPWLSSLAGISSPLLRLHQEIVEFCRYIAPSPEETLARKDSMARIQAVVESIWPQASVEVFGSSATGLYLPTSDIDAVILNSGQADIPSGLKALANALSRRKLAKNLQVIAKARVPIIKFEEAESGFNFDISFDVANGPETAANVRALMDTLPPMRSLVLVLKVFLQQRELNEVYSGGLGSYALLVMLAAFLQTHASRRPTSRDTTGEVEEFDNRNAKRRKRVESKAAGYQETALNIEPNLGMLLVDFFRLYGRGLQYLNVGVSCRRGGYFFSKRNKGFFQEDRPYLLAVEDPNDPFNDLGKNSYNISRVRMAFDHAYARLTAPIAAGESLLNRLIRLDPALFLRGPPNCEIKGNVAAWDNARLLKGGQIPFIKVEGEDHVPTEGLRPQTAANGFQAERKNNEPFIFRGSSAALDAAKRKRPRNKPADRGGRGGRSGVGSRPPRSNLGTQYNSRK